MPLTVSQKAWHANGMLALSPGTASTGQVSAPTTAIFLSASHRAAVMPGPGQPMLYVALSFFHSLPWPVRKRTTSPSPGSAMFLSPQRLLDVVDGDDVVDRQTLA